jgi:hypothetical protein
LLLASDAKTHRCPPEWEARIEDFHGDDWATVKGAFDAEDAAEKLAEKCDSEHSLLDCFDGWLVEVRKPGGEGEVQRFRVTAEASINYSASEETS